MASIDYKPAPTVREFIRHYKTGELFSDWIIGPVGSGKTTGIFFKLVYMATLQAQSPVDGKRRSRAVIVRNTMPQLTDTTITSWMYWFKDGIAGDWRATDKKFTLRFADVECEVLFRALDTADDVARVLSLETTFVLLDEFVQIPSAIVEALEARCGRFPPKKDGGATNWGMWGSSNPGNEDDWWHDALLAADPYADRGSSRAAVRAAQRLEAGKNAESTWTYFEQPSGFAAEAENLDNLPGGAQYYVSLAKDKSLHWVKQFIEVEWGYSLSGKPVLTTFNADIHIAKNPLLFRRGLKLVGGMDPGMNTAMIFGQMDQYGRLYVLSELITRGYGAKRFISDRLKPLLRTQFSEADFVISPDPAANQRAQTDERTVVDVLRASFAVKIPTENNQLPGRIDAIEHFSTRITEGGPALIIDPSCKVLIRALRSGWRYTVTNKGDTKEVPMKNVYSHPADAFSYLCQYFFKDSERTARSKDRKPLPRFHNAYTVR
jgi:hypothetical protein